MSLLPFSTLLNEFALPKVHNINKNLRYDKLRKAPEYKHQRVKIQSNDMQQNEIH